MRKLIALSIFLFLIMAIPVFAIDGILSSPINSDVGYQKAIYENHVVWQSNNGSILLYDINRKTTSTIGEGSHPNLYGGIVIWADSTLNNNVVKYDIATGTKVQIGTEGNATGVNRPWIQGNKIAWSRSTDSVIQVHDILTGQTASLSVTGCNVVVYGSRLAFSASGTDDTVNMFDLNTGIETLVASRYGYGSGPLIDENYIYWYQHDEWDNGAGATIYADRIKRYELAAGSVETILDQAPGYPLYTLALHCEKIYFPLGAPGWYDGKVYQLDVKIKNLSALNTPAGMTVWGPAVYGNKVVLSNVTGGDLRIFERTSPADEVYSLNTGSNSVTVINPYDLHIVNTLNTGAEPSDAGLSPDGTKLYVLNSADKTVTYIQTYDFQPVNTVAINPTNKQTATAVAGDDDSNVYIALKLNDRNAGIVKKIPVSGSLSELQVGINPTSLKISSDGKTLFVSNADSGNVTSVDLATFSVMSTITTAAGSKLVKP